MSSICDVRSIADLEHQVSEMRDAAPIAQLCQATISESKDALREDHTHT